MRSRFTPRAAILAAVLCALVLMIYYPAQRYFSERNRAEQLRQQNAQVQHQVDELRKHRAQLGDPDYIKAQARSRLQYVIPGETPFTVVNQRDAASTSTSGGTPKKTAKKPPQGWYSTLWDSVTAANARR